MIKQLLFLAPFTLLSVTAYCAQTAAGASPKPKPPAPLKLVNGEFSDLSGLTAGANGWQAGVPPGWKSESADTTYAINSQAGESSPVCNVSVLGFLLQDAGTLSAEADVVLNFDVSSPWSEGGSLGAALLDGDLKPLVNAEFKAGPGQRLVARKVPAGTKILVQFWATGGTTPGLDNVKLQTLAPGSASAVAYPPAPKGQLRIANGDFSDLAGLKSLGHEGWYSGVPGGWESDSKDPSYSVNVQAETNAPVCNVSVLDSLVQEAGTLTGSADVTLMFDVGNTWSYEARIIAALLDGNRKPLARAEFRAGTGQKLVAKKVPAGTKILVEFQAAAQTKPGLDNVTISK
jgi:hypothetical protein